VSTTLPDLDSDGDVLGQVVAVGRPVDKTVRFTATYAATDGSMPEAIDVVWETDFPTVETLVALVRACAAAPVARWSGEHVVTRVREQS
jgi:hypothetical protein